MKNKDDMKRKIGLIIINFIVVLICAGTYFGMLCRNYQEVALSQEEFYGEENQNLKDFKVEDAKLVSYSGDPWITCILKETTNIKVIELDIDIEDIGKKKLYGEIFDMESWESNRFRIHNGRIFVFYTNEEGMAKKNLRFDLVEEKGVALSVKSVVINSRYGMLYYTMIRFVPMMFCIWLILMMQYALFHLYKVKATKKEKITFGIWIGLQFLIVAVAFYDVIFTDMNDLEIKWLWIVCLTEITLSAAVALRMRKSTGYGGYLLEWMETVCFIIVSFAQLEMISGIPYKFRSISGGLWNILLLWFAFTVLWLIFKRRKIAIIVLNVLVVILGIANHYFFQFRGKPLELADIMLAEEALTVIKNYTYSVDTMLFFFILIEGGVIFYVLILGKERGTGHRLRQTAFVEVFLIFLGISSYMPEVDYWNMVYTTQEYGYLNSFIGYARKDMKSKKPANYSAKRVTEILEEYSEEGEVSEPVNIIVIMNEAFSDLPVTYGFDTDVDGLPFIHSLEENTIKGNMMVSVFGGTTANTEWEFLTGNTMAFLNGGTPYVQYIKRQQISLASELKELGYQTIAFHPYDPGNYNRDKVYPFLGFDEFISAESELKYNEIMRYMMSDASDFMNVIDMYENREVGYPFFMFNVTMQNHGGYSQNESAVEVTVKPQDEELQYTQLLEYLSLVRKTDEAFEKLVTYFSDVDEKTIILMFGDHQPGLDAEIYNALDENLYQEYVEIEEMEKMYTVPFILWANYSVEQESDVLTSPGFLRARLLKTAELPLNRYDQFLLTCSETYPAINVIGYYDKEGNVNEVEDVFEEELLTEYQILQHANMFDKKVRGAF